MRMQCCCFLYRRMPAFIKEAGFVYKLRGFFSIKDFNVDANIRIDNDVSVDANVSIDDDVSVDDAVSVDNDVSDHDPLSPINFYETDKNKKRITMVVDTLNKGSLFGGVATAIIVSSFFSNKK